MQTIRDFIGQELLWKPIATFKDRFELFAGDLGLADLDMSSWTSSARANSADGPLEFQRRGFWRNEIIIIDPTTTAIISTCKSRWGGATLAFADGRSLTWQRQNFMGTRKAWLDQSGALLVDFSPSAWTRQIKVTINPSGAEVPELSLLVILGLYLVTLDRRAASAASTAAVVS